jgi:hypothetical protein
MTGNRSFEPTSARALLPGRNVRNSNHHIEQSSAQGPDDAPAHPRHQVAKSVDAGLAWATTFATA